MEEEEERYCRRVPLRMATMLFDFAACVNAFYVTWDKRPPEAFSTRKKIANWSWRAFEFFLAWGSVEALRFRVER